MIAEVATGKAQGRATDDQASETGVNTKRETLE